MGGLTQQEVGARFAELICADDEWLRAEFDALVMAGFGAPPVWPSLPAPPRVPPPEQPASTAAWPERVTGPRSAGIARVARGYRQRSPPLSRGR